MGVTEDLADDLALKVIEFIDATGDESVVTELVAVLGATSQTAEEAFLTSLRVRRANIKARALLAQKVRDYKARQSKPPAGDGPTNAD